MKWTPLHERASTMLRQIAERNLTKTESDFLTDLRDRKIVWGTKKQCAYLNELDKKAELVVRTQAVSGANNRSR